MEVDFTLFYDDATLTTDLWPPSPLLIVTNKRPCAEKKGQGQRCLNRWSDCALSLENRWQCWMSVRACLCPVGIQETMRSVTGTRLHGLQRPWRQVWAGGGQRGLMTWAVLTLALFACSPHRLIFWHPKYSATFHQTTDRQPHLNGRNSTRESLRNPGLQTQKFETFIFPLCHGATLCPPRLGVSPRGGIIKGQV